MAGPALCDQILIHSLEGCVWQGFLPRCGRSSGQTSKGHRLACGPPQPCARACAQPCGPARIPGRCWASPRPPPGSPGAGAADDVARQDRTLPYWRASAWPGRRDRQPPAGGQRHTGPRLGLTGHYGRRTALPGTACDERKSGRVMETGSFVSRSVSGAGPGLARASPPLGAVANFLAVITEGARNGRFGLMEGRLMLQRG